MSPLIYMSRQGGRKNFSGFSPNSHIKGFLCSGKASLVGIRVLMFSPICVLESTIVTAKAGLTHKLDWRADADTGRFNGLEETGLIN